jgi:hypothetical protein
MFEDVEIDDKFKLSKADPKSKGKKKKKKK